MRLQRGRHEVKLMVRYPRSERRSLADFENIRVRTNDGAERPLTELARVKVERGYAEINRLDKLRTITISSDIDENQGVASEVVANLQRNFIPQLLDKYPAVRVRWEGQQEQTNESMRSLVAGYLVALLAMYVVLTLEFRSYLQPFLVMAVIPFGFVGAVCGHAILDLPLTLFSVFGLVALTGVMVNDSIVLIDFINTRLQSGSSLHDAVMGAGSQRLRPIFLNSITTVIGLVPLLLDRSFQAQVIIPMAVSMAFGQMLSTIIVLLLMPTFYYSCARISGVKA
jgi:multidrug efflux pump subunit AcrB